jgi:hypothetical protein
MKRLLTGCVCAGWIAIALAGCGQKAEVKTQKSVTTPGGTSTTTTTQEVKKSGDNPPPAP